MPTADLILHAPWILTLDADKRVLKDHALCVVNGNIAALVPSDEAKSQWQSKEVLQLDDQILMPGLVNAHTHLPMNLLRGYADDLPLMTWLSEHIWPVEGKHMGADFVRDGMRLAMAESIKSGVTCFNEMYFFPDAAAEATNAVGMRGLIGLMVIDFPTAWGSGPEEYFAKAQTLQKHYQSHPLIDTCLAPHAPYTVSAPALSKTRELAEQWDCRIAMHVHETADEVEQYLANHKKRPIAHLQELGLMDERLIAVHMTQLIDEEIALVGESGTSVIHCPQSNLKLASGFCPLGKLLDAGVTVGIGTDGAASNNDLDLLDETRTAALLAKAVSGDAACFPAAEALAAATQGSANALGLGDKIGSLEVGKAADMISLDISALECAPMYEPHSHVVYNASRTQVQNSWVAGHALMRDRTLTTLDEAELIANCQQWQRHIESA